MAEEFVLQLKRRLAFIRTYMGLLNKKNSYPYGRGVSSALKRLLMFIRTYMGLLMKKEETMPKPEFTGNSCNSSAVLYFTQSFLFPPFLVFDSFAFPLFTDFRFRRRLSFTFPRLWGIDVFHWGHNFSRRKRCFPWDP